MEPDDDAVVVRGGARQTFDRIKLLLETSIKDGDGAVLSVSAEPPRAADESLVETVRRISLNGDIPHRQVCVSTKRRLRDVGLELVVSVDDGEALNHHHVVFDVPLRDEQIAAYVDEAWDDPIQNPTGGKQRKP